MRTLGIVSGLALVFAMMGCGDDDSPPPGTDSGVRVDSGGGTGDGGGGGGDGGGGGGGMDAGPGGGTDAGPGGDTDAGPGPDDGGVAADGATVMCTGTHPLLDAGARFCGAGDCYCPPTGSVAGDTCYAATIARACCPGDVVCGAAGADAGPGCMRTHPLLDGGARFCASGQCFCAAPDSCMPAATAAECCTVAVVCTP